MKAKIAVGVVILIFSLAITAPAAEKIEKGNDISPVEDLMREHGVLRRVFLVYEEIIKRLYSGKQFPPQVLIESARVVRDFIENYHERLEEDYIFPKFEKAGKLTELTYILRDQHKAGRLLTDDIIKLATPENLKEAAPRKRLAELLRAFIRMYRPHAAREDTVLFPALRSVVSPQEYDAMGDQFEDKENALFGENGFEKMVERVKNLEILLEIEDLQEFTPKKINDKGVAK